MAGGAAHRGFTLLEMLVVLILIGIIMGLAVLSFGGTGTRDRLDEEARRLMQLIGLAREEAILQVEDLAVEVARDGYRFSRLTQVQSEGPSGTEGAGLAPGTTSALRWQPIEGDSLLRPRELQEGQSIVLSPSLDALPGTDPADTEVPRIYLAPSGEISPFELRLRDGDVEVLVIGRPDGRVSIEDEAGR